MIAGRSWAMGGRHQQGAVLLEMPRQSLEGCECPRRVADLTRTSLASIKASLHRMKAKCMQGDAYSDEGNRRSFITYMLTIAHFLSLLARQLSN